MKEFIATHKITVALVGGSLVLGSAYGSCILAPGAPVAVEEAVEEAVEAEAPAVVAPAEAEAPAVD
jgi:hypothetical protein